MTRALWALLVLPASLAACGGDEEKADTGPRPAVTAPQTSTSVTPEPETGGEGPSTAPGGDRPGAAPGPDGPPAGDSPENDVPPPPGSPAERFEQACDRNPALCE